MVTLADAIASRGFQQVHGALDIHPLIESGLLQAGPHPRAGGEVDDLVEPGARKQRAHRLGIREVSLHNFERAACRLELCQVLALERPDRKNRSDRRRP